VLRFAAPPRRIHIKDPETAKTLCAGTIVMHVARFVAQLREGLKEACDADSSAYGI